MKKLQTITPSKIFLWDQVTNFRKNLQAYVQVLEGYGRSDEGDPVIMADLASLMGRELEDMLEALKALEKRDKQDDTPVTAQRKARPKNKPKPS